METNKNFNLDGFETGNSQNCDNHEQLSIYFEIFQSNLYYFQQISSKMEHPQMNCYDIPTVDYSNLVNPNYILYWQKPLQDQCTFFPYYTTPNFQAVIGAQQNRDVQNEIDQFDTKLNAKQKVDLAQKASSSARESEVSGSSHKIQTPVSRSTKYLKKNTQSNISNQIFSFISTRIKSELILKRILQNEGEYNLDKVITFYQNMNLVKKHKKKYLNKKVLLMLCRFNREHPAFKEIGKNKKRLEMLSGEDFAKYTRILMKVYTDMESAVVIVRSKKMDKETCLEHLLRRRQIKKFIEQHLRNF